VSIIEITEVEIGHVHPHEQQQQQPEQLPAPNEQIQQQPAEEYDLFDEIINHYIYENVHRGDAAENPDVNRNTATTADAELVLYKQEPTLKLKKYDGTFNCPLTWWKYNEPKCKLLSILAAWLLCIPATSTPSECVFSVVDLAIAKDRARLVSDTANELIFYTIPCLEFKNILKHNTFEDGSSKWGG
jgi:hypothetical protein